MEALEVPQICKKVVSWPSWKIQHLIRQSNINLEGSQIGEGRPQEIDLLLGADWYWRVMTGRLRRLSDSVMAMESLFGWVLQGGINHNLSNGKAVVMHLTTATDDSIDIDRKLEQFWTLETLGISERELNSKTKLEDGLVQDQFEQQIVLLDKRI